MEFKSRHNSFFYAFVEFVNTEDAVKAMDKLNDSDFQGNRLKAEWAGKKPVDPSRFRRYERSRSRGRPEPERSPSYPPRRDHYDSPYRYPYRRYEDEYRDRDMRRDFRDRDRERDRLPPRDGRDLPRGHDREPDREHRDRDR